MMQLSEHLQAIFESSKGDFQLRVATLEQAVSALLADGLEEALGARAQRDAHTLTGSLGTFGLPLGSDLARTLELRFARSHRVEAGDAHLLEVLTALRQELDGAPCEPPATATTDAGSRTRGTQVAISDDAQDRQSRFETGLAGRDPVKLTAARILVVDDDLPTRQALAMILSGAGYDVQDVGSARDARHVLAHDPVDLLLSDISMPGETGIDLIRFALCEHPATATLLISALDDPAIAQVALDFGAYGYLSKPVRRTEVLIGVMNALRRRDTEVRERATREALEQLVELRTTELTNTFDCVESASTRGRALQANAIHHWAQSAEHRDPGISSHVKRVSHYCAVLGHAFGLHAESLGLASVLHDVGKLAIPDSIVLKRGPLTADERLAMETHANVGYEMLRGSCSSVFDLAAVIARTHHEKFDGSGYPRGLTGTQIPLEGRIAAVADVFDALTSDRVYRRGWTVESTIAWMAGERGKHFDPSVLDAFSSALDEIRAGRSLLTH